MQPPSPTTQQFSDTTLKGFLLKGIDPNATDPHVKLLNSFLVQRVDDFWRDVVVPLKRTTEFDGNKINWYFEVYKEGLEAHKVLKHPFNILRFGEEEVQEIIKSLEGKTVLEYIEMGTSYLTNCYSVLTSWQRDRMILWRLDSIYNSKEPHQWILNAQKEENGVMKDTLQSLTPGLQEVVQNIGLIISRRV